MDTLIRLACSTFSIIDDVWYDRLSEEKRRRCQGYAISPDGLKMHRLIMQARPGQIVDHINRNRLDNRKANLRFVNAEQNAWNRSKADPARPYKGVSYHGLRKRPWRAGIKVSGKHCELGTFERAEHAAYVYDQVAVALCGKYAVINGVVRPEDLSFAQDKTARRIEQLAGRPMADRADARELDEIRHRLGCRTVSDFARLLGLDNTSVRAWLTGESSSTPASMARLRSLERDPSRQKWIRPETGNPALPADALGVSADVLLGRETEGRRG